MGRFGFGQPVRRKEDARFITGAGRYLDDLRFENQSWAAFVRSPVARGRIESIDAAAARTMPGVLGVFTAADLVADGIGSLPCLAGVRGIDGKTARAPARGLMADDEVRYTGEVVAVVVGESLALARDAGEAVLVEYAELPAVTGLAEAVTDGAPAIWPDAPGNIALHWQTGDADATDKAFAEADRVVSLDMVNNRVAPSPMEPRGAIGLHDPQTGRYTLHLSTQGVHSVQSVLSKHVLKVDKSQVRVVSPDVGGGFGLKIFLFPEEALTAWTARKGGRPVRWEADRSESFLADTHGRDHRSTVELALRNDGEILGLRVRTLANLGAYLSLFAPAIPTVSGAGMLAGLYRMPAAHVDVRCVLTNTAPVDAYRGAGRPEAAYAIERAIDHAARELGLPPDAIRRRNFIANDEFPFTTALGETYDSGDFERNMDDAMAASGWGERQQRKDEAARHGRLYGIGMSTYIEACAGGGDERVSMRFEDDGTVSVLVGSQSNGQGHETAYAQLAAEAFGIDIDRVNVVQGDSDVVTFGRGTGGSRALGVVGAAVQAAATKIIEKGRSVAGHVLEAAQADIEFEEGRYVIAGTDRSVGLFEVAQAARADKGLSDRAADDELGDGIAGLDDSARFKPAASTYPNGCHVCEVEIERDTGRVHVVGYTVVDDFGVVLNPLLLEGQVHGGVGQGIGQALLEEVVYDRETGQLVTGSF
ncbi:MAG: xanthine dehydrogenase family protein molybdopterin-binding subunit, partial [Acetobacterales bacterium]